MGHIDINVSDDINLLVLDDACIHPDDYYCPPVVVIAVDIDEESTYSNEH